MLHQHRTQGWLGNPDKPGGLRVPRCLRPVARRWVVAVTAVRASTAPASVRPSPATVAPPGVA